MKTTPTPDSRPLLEKLAKLNMVLADLHEKQSAVVAEMQALLAGQAGIGEQCAGLYETWQALWQGPYGTPYVFQMPKDATLMKRLIRSTSAPEVARRMERYLLARDAFTVQARHSFGLFYSTFNTHGVPALAPASIGLQAPAHEVEEEIARGLDIKRRRLEMRQRGISDDAIEAIFDREYDERHADESRSLAPDPRD